MSVNDGGSIAAVQVRARAALAAAGVPEAALEARLLLAEALGVPAEVLLIRRDEPLEPAAGQRFDALLQRRLWGEPVAYILGRREFWSLPLQVTADTLVPRPDSETLIEAALAWADARPGGRDSVRRVLDLGTGSGCLLLALLNELSRAEGIGLDRSLAALRVAQRNAAALRLCNRAHFVCGDWGAALTGAFDLIVCNPPYISDTEWPTLDNEVRNFEPAQALRGGLDGCDAYRRIFADVGRLLNPKGAIWVEIGGTSARKVSGIAAAAGLQAIETRTDLAGRPRALGLRRRDVAVAKNLLGNQLLPV